MLLSRIAHGAFVLTLIALAGCSPKPASVASVADRTWTTVNGEEVELNSLMGKAATVFITLDPECPFCQLYTQAFEGMSEKYAAQGVNVVGLYAGQFMEQKEAATFSGDAGFDFPQVMDDQCVLSRALQARVTPECFLVDAQGTVVYRGAFDDRAIRQGRKKYEAQKHYLADALNAFLATGKPQEEVPAVGCIVECEE